MTSEGNLLQNFDGYWERCRIIYKSFHWCSLLRLIRILVLMLVPENATVVQMSNSIQSHQHSLPSTDHSLIESCWWNLLEVLTMDIENLLSKIFHQSEFSASHRSLISLIRILNGILWKFWKLVIGNWWCSQGHLLCKLFHQSEISASHWSDQTLLIHKSCGSFDGENNAGKISIHWESAFCTSRHSLISHWPIDARLRSRSIIWYIWYTSVMRGENGKQIQLVMKDIYRWTTNTWEDNWATNTRAIHITNEPQIQEYCRPIMDQWKVWVWLCG